MTRFLLSALAGFGAVVRVVVVMGADVVVVVVVLVAAVIVVVRPEERLALLFGSKPDGEPGALGLAKASVTTERSNSSRGSLSLFVDDSDDVFADLVAVCCLPVVDVAAGNEFLAQTSRKIFGDRLGDANG